MCNSLMESRDTTKADKNRKLVGAIELKHKILAFSGSFCYIPICSVVIPPHSCIIPAGSGIFPYHSFSFRLNLVLFRHIPVYSGIFRSVPVFINAPWESMG